MQDIYPRLQYAYILELGLGVGVERSGPYFKKELQILSECTGVRRRISTTATCTQLSSLLCIWLMHINWLRILFVKEEAGCRPH